ncbi:MAG: aspartyl protease family protein [Candidatus Cyclobacteriaceae bacterium M3_2C_046]
MCLRTLFLFNCFFIFSGIKAQSAVEIPFLNYEDYVIITGELKGEKLNFIFDTGASHTILHKQTADQLGLKPNSYAFSKRSGSFISSLSDQKVKMGALKLNLKMFFIDLTQLNDVLDYRIDGIIGYDLLAQNILQINYDQQQLILFKKYEPDPEAHIYPIEVAAGRSYLPLKITFHDQEQVEERFLLDNGSSYPVSITSYHLIEEKNLFERIGDYYEFHSLEIFGDLKRKIGGKVRQINLGNHLFKDVPLSLNIRLIKNSRLNSGFYAGTIGNELMKKFNITLDYKNQKSYWMPSQNYLSQFRVNRLGCVLRKDDSIDRIFIKYVFEDSPAEKIGLRPNDILLRINQKEINSQRISQVYDLLASDLQRLEIQRGRTIIHIDPVPGDLGFIPQP